MELIGSGLRDLDLLLGGGFIRDSPVLLLTETGTMGELLPLQIINHRVQEGDFGFILDLDFPPVRIREWFKSFNWNLKNFEDEGRLFIVDGFTNLYGRLTTEEKYVIENPRDIIHLDSYIYNMTPLIENYKNKLFGVLFLSNIFLTKGQQIDKIINLVYKNRINLSQYGLSVFLFDKGMMDEKTLSSLEHAFDYIIELKVAEQEKRFQKYLRVTKSPLINYVSDMVPYEVVPSGISLRSEIIREFESMKQNTKMLENGVIDFLGVRMSFFPAEAYAMLSKILIEKYEYEVGSDLLRSFGEEIAHLIFKISLNKLKLKNVDEAAQIYARIGTLIGLGEIIIQQYNPEEGVIRFRIPNSPICTYFKNTGKKMGAFLEGVIARMAELYLGPKSICKEVKCISKGDEHCEYLITFRPEEAPAEIKSEKPQSGTPKI
ncbi:MAG: ATPase domain-containing protein [Candidatus Lokiarchaeia archaeon]